MIQASFIFREFDHNHTGSLSHKEWKQAMKRLGYNFDKGEAKRVFRMVDRDGSGSISEREFAEFWVTNS